MALGNGGGCGLLKGERGVMVYEFEVDVGPQATNRIVQSKMISHYPLNYAWVSCDLLLP